MREINIPKTQMDVLRLIAVGYSNKGIAKRLELSVRTVEQRIESIYGALGAGKFGQEYNQRVMCVRVALQRGYLTMEDLEECS